MICSRYLTPCVSKAWTAIPGKPSNLNHWQGITKPMCRCTLFMCSQIELLSRKKELEKWQYQKKGKDKITKSEWIRKRKTKKSQKYPTQREIRNQSVTNKNRQQNSHPQNQRNKTQKEIWCERECHLFLLHCVCLRHYYHMPGWSWNLQNG